MIQTFAQGISTAVVLNPNLTLDAACNMAIGFDNTPVGRERLKGGRVMALQCYNCKHIGHINRECPAPQKRSDRVAAADASYAATDSVIAVATVRRGGGGFMTRLS